MQLAWTILGGIVGLGLAVSAASAEPPVRPFSRTDAVAERQAEDLAALAAVRPAERPVHMIRYPVRIETRAPAVRPKARMAFIPDTRWEHRQGHEAWTWSAMSAVQPLAELTPRDIDAWCPGYRQNPPRMRAAFWVGMMSALAKHESTWNPRAVGGGGRWFGLLQIYPPTAQYHGCRAQSGEALQNPVLNLSCAARIMTRTVKRDNAVALFQGRWRGVAADWGPMSNSGKVAEMSAWTRAQDYCKPVLARETSPRPVARPDGATVSTMDAVSPGSG